MNFFVVLYVFILLLAALRTRLRPAMKIWSGLWMMLLAGAALFTLVNNAPSGLFVVAILGLFLAYVVVPAFFIGFAWLNGSIVGKLAQRKEIYWILLIPSLALPVAAVFWLNDAQEQSKAEKAAQIAAFQQTNIEGTLGTYPVTLPVSPQARIRFICSGVATSFPRHCEFPLGFVPSLSRSEDEDAVVAPYLSNIWLMRVHPTCIDRGQSGRHSCLLRADLDEWCARRLDLSNTVWCNGGPTSQIEFVFDEKIPDEPWDADQWDIVQVPELSNAGGQDHLLIECQDAGFYGPTCRAKFEVAPRVTVNTWMASTTRTDAVAEAMATRAFAQEVWSVLTVAP